MKFESTLMLVRLGVHLLALAIWIRFIKLVHGGYDMGFSHG